MDKKPDSARSRARAKSRANIRNAALWPSTLTACCPFCGQTTEVSVDVMGGRHQSYVEDCIVCCRPSLVHVEADADGDPSLWLERADG